MPKPKTTLPAFAPVTRVHNRHDGWTPARQRGFIEALALYGSVRAAANAVGMTPEGAYLLRRHAEGAEFRAAWQAALDLGVQKLEDAAMERALNGIEVPVYSYGKLVGTRIKYNDRLLMFMLRNRAPKRFTEGGARGLNAVDKQSLARLKKQWRKEWERGSALQSDADEQATYDSIHEKLRNAHDNWLAMMSDKTRAAHDHFTACEAEDKANNYRHFADRHTRAAAEAADPPIPLPPPGYRVGPAPAEEAPDDGPKVHTLKDEWD
ncbi:MAG: hypothetical protein ABIT09_08605 [Croceibacterium sp.]